MENPFRNEIRNILYQLEQYIEEKLKDWMWLKLLYNKLLEKYKIETSKDVDKISESDCEKLMKDITIFADKHKINISELLKNKIDKTENNN